MAMKATKKIPRKKRARAGDDDPEGRKIAAMQFKPERRIDLSKGMTNEELGHWMIPVRMAAVTLTKTKAELIDVVRALDAGAEFKKGSEVYEFMENLEAARDKIQGIVRDVRRGTNANLDRHARGCIWRGQSWRQVVKITTCKFVS